MFSLSLNVDPTGWRMFMQRKLDNDFTLFSQKIWQRDNYSCQFCGWSSKAELEVINLDGNYYHNKASNLHTACRFCAACFFLESVGAKGQGSGLLIYLPEMSQNHLNGLCHILFKEMSDDTEYKELAQTIYRQLKLRSQIIEDEWGETMHEPSLFGQLLIEWGDLSLLKKPIFSAIRLLPLRGGTQGESDQNVTTMTT